MLSIPKNGNSRIRNKCYHCCEFDSQFRKKADQILSDPQVPFSFFLFRFSFLFPRARSIILQAKVGIGAEFGRRNGPLLFRLYCPLGFRLSILYVNVVGNVVHISWWPHARVGCLLSLSFVATSRINLKTDRTRKSVLYPMSRVGTGSREL